MSNGLTEFSVRDTSNAPASISEVSAITLAKGGVQDDGTPLLIRDPLLLLTPNVQPTPSLRALTSVQALSL